MATFGRDTMKTLDHVDRIEIPESLLRNVSNECFCLANMTSGLEFLSRQVARCEELVAANLPATHDVFLFGNCPELKGVPQPLLICWFDWYAVTACKYVRLVGEIARQHDLGRPLASQYLKRIIPEVQVYRDKVAAHLAWTSSNTRDSKADRRLSATHSLSYANGRFFCQSFRLHMRSSGVESSSEPTQAWSLTEVHAKLGHRYWPKPVAQC